jgi:hypothetical protein
VRAVVLASGGLDETLSVLTVAARLRRRGHEVRLGLPAPVLATARGCGLEAVAVDGFPAPAGPGVDAVRELCLGAELVVGTASTEDVAATMAAFVGVPYAGLHLAPRPRRRAVRGEWGGTDGGARDRLDALRDLLQLPRAVRPPGLAAARAGALEVHAYDAALVPPAEATAGARGAHLVGFLGLDAEVRAALPASTPVVASLDAVERGGALVHRGEALITAAAARAGVPSVVVGPDPAGWGRRLEAAGAAVTLRASEPRPAAVTHALAVALGPGTVAAARSLARRVTTAEAAMTHLVELLEERTDYRASQFA